MIGYRCDFSGSTQDISYKYTVNVGGTLIDTRGCDSLPTNIETEDVIIGNKVSSAASLLYNCRNFNGNVIVGTNVVSLSGTFRNCINFNGFVNFYANKENIDCSRAFYNCVKFNQPITIPQNVKNCAYMFYNCTDMSKNIYINGNPTVMCMLQQKNNSKRVNIFCNNLTNLTNTTASASVVGAAITWTAMTNGYYNAVYNVYLYNNYVGT